MADIAEILSGEGFELLGQLRHDLELAVWWHSDAAVQLIVIAAGRSLLLKGSKTYSLVSSAAEEEIWARDLRAAQDHLESHFRELHLSWSFFRDVPAFLAERQAERVHRGRSGHLLAVEDSANLASKLNEVEASLASLRRLSQLDTGDSPLLNQHLGGQETRWRAELAQLKALAAQAEGSTEIVRRLQQEYRRKGSAMCLLASIASNLQVVADADEGRDAVRSIVKELRDIHRFQVTQVFGGRLKVKISEIAAPALSWIEQWFGGSLSPAQLERLAEAHGFEAEALSRHSIVTADEDVTAEGTVVERRKLVAPRMVASILERLDAPHRETIQPGLPGPRLRIGVTATADGCTGDTWDVPLRALGHTIISGSTGSGKSFAARVIVEEAACHRGVGILILDPRNQSAGVLAPQDRQEVLARYSLFRLAEPQGFPFRYFGPGGVGLPPLPRDMAALGQGRNIVSLKALDDEGRCDLFASILDAVFGWASREETEGVRLVIVVEEAQLFTRRLVRDSAKPAAARAESAIDRILREGRKFGIAAIVSSQSIMDFARDAAAIRQNATTKVFFRNSDREIDYARDYLEDPRELVRLIAGVGLICNPAWGVARVVVRPPLSKVWDLNEEQTLALLGRSAVERRALSGEAEHLLQWARGHLADVGTPPNMSDIGMGLGITSKRRLQVLVQELVAAGRARTYRLRSPGQPRVIEPVNVAVDGSGRTTDAPGPKGAA